MKAPSLAVALLLGIIAYPEQAQTVEVHNHLHRVPRSHAFVAHNRGDEFIETDALDQDIEKETEEEEDLTPKAE